MDKLLDFIKEWLGLTDEQVKKAELDLNKTDDKPEDKPEEKPVEKEEEKTKQTGETVEEQSAGATSNTEKEGEEPMETVDAKEYKALQEEIKSLKSIIEKQKLDSVAEKRATKIKGIKDCLDYDYLTTLLDGVEDKDFDNKVEEIKKSKGYLFKQPETEGFNPAPVSEGLNEVESAFYKINPDLLNSNK